MNGIEGGDGRHTVLGLVRPHNLDGLSRLWRGRLLSFPVVFIASFDDGVSQPRARGFSLLLGLTNARSGFGGFWGDTGA